MGCKVLDLGIITKIGGEERRREVRYGETKHSYVSGWFGFRRRSPSFVMSLIFDDDDDDNNNKSRG